MRKNDIEELKKWEKKGVTLSTIQSFKGLENTIVILFGFKDIISEFSQKLLYIGISRAKQRLYLVVNKALEEDYKKLIKSNINLI